MDRFDDSRRLQFETFVIEHHVRLGAFVRSLGIDPDWVDVRGRVFRNSFFAVKHVRSRKTYGRKK